MMAVGTMKRKLKWLAIVLAVLLLGFGTAFLLRPQDRITAPGGGQPEGLKELESQLKGGPIEIRVGEQKLDPESVKAMKKRLAAVFGSDAEPDACWAVSLTDREFPENLVKDRACWLLKFDLRTKIKLKSNPFTTGYVALDRNDFRLLLAFSAPRAPWWKQVEIKNAKVQDRFIRAGNKGGSLDRPPEITIKDLLTKFLPEEVDEEVFAKTKNIVLRFFGLTDLSYGNPVKRVEGTEIIPIYSNTPVWQVSLQGIDLTVNRRGTTRRYQEANLYFSAQTGKHLFNSYFR
jgi:hypothetical protein